MLRGLLSIALVVFPGIGMAQQPTPPTRAALLTSCTATCWSDPRMRAARRGLARFSGA